LLDDFAKRFQQDTDTVSRLLQSNCSDEHLVS
jgi:hypothetical protein